MNKERLLRLADLLEADAANPNGVKFDLRGWAIPSKHLEAWDSLWAFREKNPDHLRFFEPAAEVQVSCGTAACAMGLAVISGAFLNEGLSYEIDLSDGQLSPVFTDERGLRHASWAAAIEFFDLKDSDGDYDWGAANHLFDATEYEPSHGAEAELEVARRIRAMCA